MNSAPFNPPSANLPNKPFVPEWIPPPITKQTENFATLTSIDLSLMDSDDPAVVARLIEQVKSAIREDGFLFLENYGISLEQVRMSNSNKVTWSSLTKYYSSTVSLPLRNTVTTISARRINKDYSSTPRQENGLDTSTHTDSRSVDYPLMPPK